MRSPTMVSWPGTIKPAVSDFSWAFWDFMPTVAELAGAALLPLLFFTRLGLCPEWLTG
jgi:arylsulfatase A-like enzyme|eukprot:COSAG01_NODE_7072_length_3367_cov_2.824051_4_plen_58_part_00